MSVAPFTRRIPKLFRKTITFTGAANLGAVGTVAIATVTEAITIIDGGVRCSTLLTSAGGGTISLGCAGNVDGIIEATVATAIDANEWWQNATPEVGISPAIINLNVLLSIIATVAVADITAGVLVFEFYWLPRSANGNMA